MHVGESANKKSVLEELLELGMVLVALDARVQGVDVPGHLDRDPQLRLNLSFRFGLPMSLDPWGIRATLTFGGVPYACRFPWKAIYLLVSHVNGEPYLFPDEVPAELLAQVGVESAWSIQPSAKPKPAPRPKFRLVQPDEDAEAAEAETAQDPAAEDDSAGEGSSDARRSSPTGGWAERRRPGKLSKASRPAEADVDADGGDANAAAPTAPPGKARGKGRASKAKPEPLAEAPRHATPSLSADASSPTDAASSSSEAADTPKPSSKGRRGHLRLVK